MKRSISRRTAWLVLGAAAAGMTLTVVAQERRARYKHNLLQLERRALDALWRARRVDARRWAPAALNAAERSFREGIEQRRLVQSSWRPFPDFSTAELELRRAYGVSRRAAETARLQRSAARDGAEVAIERAAELVETGARVAATIRVPPPRRALLSQAQIGLLEARSLQRGGDYLAARSRAERAATLAAELQDHAATVAARYANADQIQLWKRWERETVDWSRRQGKSAILVYKEEHRLTLYSGGRAQRTYRAELGPNWVADKLHAGDDATPEGRYRILQKKSGAATRYHKALLLDYPNSDDRRAYERARRAGQIPSSIGIGSLIEIHGDGGRGQDWTRGCVALTNSDIDDLFRRVAVGTPVTIIGGDGDGAVAEMAKLARAGPPVPEQP